MARQSRRDGHRRGRVDRRRALPADRAVPAGEARAVRHFGSGGLRDPDGARRRVSAAAAGQRRGRRQARGAGRRGAGARAARASIFHAGGLQARAADGGDQRVAGGAQQRLRHLGAGARRGRGQGREVRARVLGQGRQSDERDGRDQTPRRNRLPEPAGRGHSVRARALRQRVRQRGQRHPALPRADRPRRPGHGDASRHHALLHVAVRGHAAAAAGGAAGTRRRDPRARHGRARAHRRSRARHDPAVRRRSRPDRHRVHRIAARERSCSRSCWRRKRRRSRRRIRSCASRRRARRTSTPCGRWSRGASAIARPTTPKFGRA